MLWNAPNVQIIRLSIITILIDDSYYNTAITMLRIIILLAGKYDGTYIGMHANIIIIIIRIVQLV